MIDGSKKYQRLFRHPGLRLFINGMWVKAYDDLGAIALMIGPIYTGYMPKASIRRTLKEGAEFYGNREKFKAYFREFLDHQKQVSSAANKISDGITKQQAADFIELLLQVIRYYKITEFFYTDGAYAKVKENKTIAENLKEFERIKNESREFLNLAFLGQSSYAHKFLEKISQQFNIALGDLLHCSSDEILNIFDGKKISPEILRDRNIACITYLDGESLVIHAGEKALKAIQDFNSSLELVGKTVKGICANRGQARGKIKVITYGYDDFNQVGKMIATMNQGDILVAETTSPELVLACRKAAAIVTDQGGMMSHAAIISRELNIPCIVGTNNATEILKNGDLVEVDADNGMVKVIK